MINVTTYYGRTKCLSYLCLIIPILLELLVYKRDLPGETIVLSLFGASSILILLPIREDKRRTSFIEALIILSGIIALSALSLSLCFKLLIGVVVISSCIILNVRLFLSQYRRLFKSKTVMFFIQSLSAFANLVVLLVLAILAILTVEYPIVSIPLFVLNYALLLYYTMKGRLSLISYNQEVKLRKYYRGIVIKSSRNIYEVNETDLSKMEETFAKINAIIKEEDVYRDKDFSEEDLARMLCTNRTTISNVINIKSGTNFRCYLNRFRIEYAKKLIISDPNMRVTEVTEKCGFRNTNTFVRAFKEATGTTPGEYIKSVKYDQRLPSSLKVVLQKE